VQNVLRSPGQPLDRETRGFFEPRFNADFSGVRLHTDGAAAESAGSVNATAYTVGEHIAFQAGRYDPVSPGGRSLLAHELTHVLQNRKGGQHVTGSFNAISHPADTAEQEADGVARRVLNGHRVVVNGTPSAAMQRDLTDPEKAGIGVGAGLGAVGLGFGIAWLAGAFDSKKKKTDSTQKKPDPAQKLAAELQTLIAGATWKEIRKRIYPKESQAGIRRAHERKAGTRPDLTGLGRISTLERFAAAVRDIQRRWRGKSPDDRVKMLGNAADVELLRADVPAFLQVDKEPMQSKGYFEPPEWKFVVSQELVTGATLDDTNAAEVANTTLHESRHAEQQFLAARFAAGMEGKDAATISTEQEIPRRIAGQAVAKKFNARTDPALLSLGRQMNESTVTQAPQNQAATQDVEVAIKDLDTKRGEAQTALQALKANPTARIIADGTAKRDALRAQIAVVEQKYGLYRRIPHEADAHEVGDAASEAFKRWPK
jgi:hypothetical protein